MRELKQASTEVGPIGEAGAKRISNEEQEKQFQYVAGNYLAKDYSEAILND